MNKEFKRIAAWILLVSMMMTMMFGSVISVYADETAAQEETTEKETISVEDRAYRRIFVAGDDTVCNWDDVGSDIRAQGEYDPKAGWVEMLNFFIKDTNLLKIQNGANTGFSIKTFMDGSEARFKANVNQYRDVLGTSGGGQPGDYVLIQFGQHDAKAPSDDMSAQDKKYAEEAYVDVATYKEYLVKYIEYAKEMYVTPILVTPIADWKVDADGKFISSYAEYAQAVRDVAAEQQTLLIDMDQKSRDFYATLNDEELKKVFLFCEPGQYDTKFKDGIEDTENFQIYGAMHMARLVCEGLVETKEQYLVDNIVNYTLPTAKPKNPDVAVTMNKEKMFKMQWKADTNAQVYFVYQKINGEWTLVKQTEGVVYNTNTPIDTSNCEYKVVAMNHLGYSGDSNIVTRSVGTKEEADVTTTGAEKEEGGIPIVPIIIAVVVVLVIVIVVVVIIIKKRGEDDDEYEEYDEDEEYEEDDEDEDDEDDEYEDDEYDEYEE